MKNSSEIPASMVSCLALWKCPLVSENGKKPCRYFEGMHLSFDCDNEGIHEYDYISAVVM